MNTKFFSSHIFSEGGLVFLFFIVTMFHATGAYGQAIGRAEIASSFNPVGSGARALGMGGAFIAVADDATAASWNPGGLIQLEKPEISAVGSAVSVCMRLRVQTRSIRANRAGTPKTFCGLRVSESRQSGSVDPLPIWRSSLRANPRYAFRTAVDGLSSVGLGVGCRQDQRIG